MSSFAQKMRALRKQQKLSMKALSKKMGVSDAYIAMLETAKRAPNREMVQKLVDALYPQGAPHILDELLLLAGFSPSNPDPYLPPEDPLQRFDALWQTSRDFQLFLGLIRGYIRAGRTQTAQIKLQEGLQIYQDSYQLHSLLAQLDQLKGLYDTARLAQENAIAQYENQAEPDPAILSALYCSLGTIAFEQAHPHLLNFESSKNKAEKQQALTLFEAARQNFEKALEIDSQNLYAQDEWGRVLFNLAHLSPKNKSQSLWKQTIAALEQVLISPQAPQLSPIARQETAAFLAHAYTKAGDLEAAEKALAIMRAYRPESWLLHYLSACLYTKKSIKTQDETCLDQALTALEYALNSPEKNNPAAHQALDDLDLAFLRQHRAQAFQTLIKSKE